MEWIATDRVRRSIAKYFRKFLTEYTDDNLTSIYGERIRNLGESVFTLFFLQLPSDMFSQTILNHSKCPMST